jgi:hypothetical protein
LAEERQLDTDSLELRNNIYDSYLEDTEYIL